MNKQLQKVHSLPSQLCDDQGHYELACTKLAGLKEFTANYVWEHYPARYRLAVRLMSEMLSTSMIAEACEMSAQTVEAIRIREKWPIEKEREHLLSTVRAGTRVCAERVLELASSMNAKESAVAFGILAERGQLLAGEPTVIVGKEEQVQHQDFNTLLASLPQANVIEVVDGEAQNEAEQSPHHVALPAGMDSTPTDERQDGTLGTPSTDEPSLSVTESQPTKRTQRNKSRKRSRKTGGGGSTQAGGVRA